MYAREILEQYIECYGLDVYVDLELSEWDLKVQFTRKGSKRYQLKNYNEYMKLKAILDLMELEYEEVSFNDAQV